ncbi:MAG: hypothetical protein H7246_00230 [Phycisphaerae bacterium]|nr:hypothetical protein [Saprospiraceae bacterium]
MKNSLQFSLLLVLISSFTSHIHAQITPSLSIQGILKKSNGVAVEDGNYSMTFKLYEVETGGTAIWEEPQSGVEVSNGIYSTVLPFNPGAYPFDPNTVKFDKLYYLGVTVGSAELTPRILLTSAPYALALIGTTNKFPSGGKVFADSIQVNGGVLARGGTPGANGVNRNGYAFTGNGGDKDSGVFSTANGKVSLYADNTEVLAVTPTNVQSSQPLTVQGVMTSNGVNISNNASLSYNGLSDWRLVDTDNFSGGADGWEIYDKLSGQQMGWNNPSSSGASPTTDMGSFIGDVLLPTNNDHVLKKQFTVAGSFTQIKVKFRYYIIDTWGWGGGDRSWAAFSTSASGTGLRVGWAEIPSFINDGNNDFNVGGTGSFGNQANFYGQADKADNWIDVEMTAKSPGANFWVFIGAAIDQDVADERFAVGSIEIYVR